VSNAPASAATFLKCRIKRFDDFCQIEKMRRRGMIKLQGFKDPCKATLKDKMTSKARKILFWTFVIIFFWPRRRLSFIHRDIVSIGRLSRRRK